MKMEHFLRYFSSRYRIEKAAGDVNEVLAGFLHPIDGSSPTRIVDGLPRFVEGQGYAGNFGLQWNIFRATQLDSVTGLSLSFNRFWNNTKWKPMDLFGKTVLEAGSGAGRFTEILLSAGAKVVSFDLTNAVDANWSSNKKKGDLFLFQGDVFDIPFPDDYFDYVFCYGVLQHTPDPDAAYRNLFKKLKPGGRISVDNYRRFTGTNVWATPKYFWRPVTTQMAPEKLLFLIRCYIPLWLPFDTLLRRIPFFGPRLLSIILIPCWNYLHLGLTREQRKEWAIMDTFDALAAHYDFPKSREEIREMVASLQNAECEIFYGSNGIVANIRKSAANFTGEA